MRGKTCYIVSFKNLTIQIVFKKMCVQFLKINSYSGRAENNKFLLLKTWLFIWLLKVLYEGLLLGVRVSWWFQINWDYVKINVCDIFREGVLVTHLFTIMWMEWGMGNMDERYVTWMGWGLWMGSARYGSKSLTHGFPK